jgi:hypothetical protein
MLNQQDLDQFKTIVAEEIGKKTIPIENLIDKKTSALEKDVGSIKTDIARIRKDINSIINFFDRDYLELRGRVERIETHLGIQSFLDGNS